MRITFDEVTAPQGAELIGRNHLLTTALADYLLETALAPEHDTPLAARCGLARTGAVARRTVLLLLRVRMLIEHAPGRPDPGRGAGGGRLHPQRRRDPVAR